MAKYGAAAAKSVKSAVHRAKTGTLKSSSGQKVKSRKQAIAIGLNEARAKGGKVPAPPSARKTSSAGSRKAASAGSRKTTRKTAGTSTRKTTSKASGTGSRKRATAAGRKKR